MRRFMYSNECLTGVFGVSDYCFGCVIDAETEFEALEWGQKIAALYNERFGLLPKGRQLDAKSLIENGSISEWNPEDDQYLDRHKRCTAGVMPDLEAWEKSRVKFSWD